ncbi:MAG: sulfatase-like hydrolase/transferase [Bacteroidota bacterium]|nr:sulfatase-like hydrolase/transferase [Bacteroidota bacterium]
MNKLLPISVGIMLFSFQNHEKKTEASRVSEIAKPNILFLFADDQRADALGCSGNPYIKTPNIDNIAKVGVRFANSYVMGGHHGAICAPSRAMLMSGKSLFHVYDKLEGVHTMNVKTRSSVM